MPIDSTSLWLEPPTDRSGEPLRTNLECDVCVIGAGIAGLSTAYLLAKAGRSVIVLENRREFADGETAFTTAHLSDAFDDRYSRLEVIRGAECAQLAYESHSAAIDTIESIVTEERIDCDFARVDGYLFPSVREDVAKVEAEYAAARRAGADVEALDYVPYHPGAPRPCLKFNRQARIHPLKYLAGLARVFRELGGRIFTGVRAERAQGGSPCHTFVHDGPTVRSQATVIATNVPIGSGALLSAKLAAYTTYAIGIDIPAHTVIDALYWDVQEPYHYVRVQPGSDGVDVLIVGGEDHKTGQATDQIERWERLACWAKQNFPHHGIVRSRWSGQVFETMDGLALIGADPSGEDNVYIASGDSGMGMTHGTIAGLMLCDELQHRRSPWAALYDPARTPPLAASTLLKENINVAAQFTDWVTPGQVSGEEKIAPGHGAIVRDGLTKLALYRDDAGELHSCSAVCPHLGCIVRWNDAEATWECPCHGSRFSGEGKLLHGPATADLHSAEPAHRS